MSRWYRKTIRWSPVIIVGVLKVYMMVADKGIEILKSYSVEQWYTLTGKEALQNWLSISLTAALAWSLFIDNNFGKKKQEMKDEDENPQNPNYTGSRRPDGVTPGGS